MVTDTISDMLTRIRNATMVKHQIVQIPVTKMSVAIANILKDDFNRKIDHNQRPENLFIQEMIRKNTRCVLNLKEKQRKG